MVEVIGFDPSKITKQQLAQAMDAADAVWNDASLRNILKDFAWNYAKAQHAIELTEMGGGAAFEIILTAILAAVTGGAGLFAATAAKARHVAKFRKLGDLLVDFAKASKKMAQRVTTKAKPSGKAAVRSFDDVKTDLPAQTKVGDGPKFHNDPNTSVKSSNFKTVRKVDLENLSDNDAIAADRMMKQGWREDKIAEVLSSGEDFRLKEIKAGDKLYGFGTEGFSKDLNTSAYWMDEAEFNKMKTEHFDGTKWDNDWKALNKDFPGWIGDPEPNGFSLWGGISTKYAEGTTGKVTVVQSAEKAKIGGGDVWKNAEKDVLEGRLEDGIVTELSYVVVK